jgi:hypothetical protein
MDSLLKPKTRVNHLAEIYSKIFYDSRVKPDIEAATQSDIASIRQKIEGSLKSEPQHIQDEVKRIRDEQVAAASVKKKKRATSADDDGDDDDDYSAAMDPQEIQR